MIRIVQSWFRPKKDDEPQFIANLERGTLVANADEILVDGNGFILRYGDIRRSYTHAEIDDVVDSEITDEEVIRWLSEASNNEIRQVANPDYLPYDRREGF